MTAPDDRYAQLIRLTRTVADKGWLPATSGNLSMRLTEAPLTFAITRSGADKTRLTAADILPVDGAGQPLQSTPYHPSAETGVHARLYSKLPCAWIVHVHTVHNNIVSQLHFAAGALTLADHELLKALDHWEADASIQLPIVENHHDLQALAAAVAQAATADVPGVLVRNHGIYAWGNAPDACLRYLEAFEFLFQYQVMMRQVGATRTTGV